MQKHKIVSLFSGCGGLDLGFKQAGFNVIWANEFDPAIWETYQANHPNTFLNKKNINNIKIDDIPDCDGIIAGIPCQSWSEAGTQKGIDDERGELFFTFLKILKHKKPLFFVIENVRGILFQKHDKFLNWFKNKINEYGYDYFLNLINANDFGVAQTRKRVFLIGFKQEMNVKYEFPKKQNNKKLLKDVLNDAIKPVAALDKNYHNPASINNNEYMIGNFSSIYMSRNRVRGYDEPSFTIQASGRHAPLHPQAPRMIKVNNNKFIFVKSKINFYRRLSVRECANIQTFPKDFIFYYQKINDGYKMVGNAVPVELAKIIAKSILKKLKLQHEPFRELSNSSKESIFFN